MKKVVEVTNPPAVLLTMVSTNGSDQLPLQGNNLLPSIDVGQLPASINKGPKILDLRPQGGKGLGFIKS